MLQTLALALLAAAGPGDLAFMKGAWEGGAGPMKFEERWTEEAGGLMLGVSRTIKGDRAVAFEFLRIEFRKDGIFYVAQPGGRPKTEFKGQHRRRPLQPGLGYCLHQRRRAGQLCRQRGYHRRRWVGQ